MFEFFKCCPFYLCKLNIQLSSFNELIKTKLKQNKLCRKKFGKKIPGKLVNPNWEIVNNVYSISNFGVVRNNKT